MSYHTSLNLKSDDAYRLARELADLTGESMTAAVIEALRERLDRIRRGAEQDSPETRTDRILAVSRGCASLWKEPYRSMDHGDLLYDDRGLPRDC
jgi:antitoxin VapB